ncbi:MAG: carboxypeptidase-like regulatory domain-containing protein [Bacteroidales bacterium]
MKRITSIFIIIILALLPTLLMAQKAGKKITIKGTVLDGENRPVSNAFVMIDNVKSGQMTDLNGKYTVKVKPEAIRIGIVSLANGLIEEDISGRTQIDFNYKSIGTSKVTVNNEVPPGEEYVNTEAIQALRKRTSHTTLFLMIRIKSLAMFKPGV